jgi:hypothetical protein
MTRSPGSEAVPRPPMSYPGPNGMKCWGHMDLRTDVFHEGCPMHQICARAGECRGIPF